MHKTRSNILEELSKNCRISTTELAKRVKQPRHIVAYHKEKLMKDVIINHEVLLDYSVLGYTEYIVYLKLFQFSKIKKELCAMLSEHPAVRWMAAVFPNYNLRVCLVVKNASEVEKFIHELEETYGNHIVGKEIVLSKGQIKNESYTTGLVEKNVERNTISLGESDKKLISSLVEDPNASLVDLATKVGSSIETVRQKIKKFQKSGLITCFSAKHDAEKVGHNFWCTVLLKINKLHQHQSRLQSLLYSDVKFGKTRKTFGAWNIEMTLFGKSYKDFLETIDQLEHFFGSDMEGYQMQVYTERFVNDRLPKNIFNTK